MVGGTVMPMGGPRTFTPGALPAAPITPPTPTPTPTLFPLQPMYLLHS